MSEGLQKLEDAEADAIDLEKRQKERYLGDESSSSEDNNQKKQDEEGTSEESDNGDGDDEDSESVKKAGSDEDEQDEESSIGDVDLDEDAEAEEVEPLIGEYSGYANDTLALLYTPLFVGLLWVFYDETVVANLYGIKVQDFVYYFLFSLVIVPWQVIIDICFLNIVEWYHLLPIHDYLDYMAYRFSTRKSRWKGNEPFTNEMVAAEVRSLDQLCFSSQHYFVQTLYVSGMT